MMETVIYRRKSASESSEITAFDSYWIVNAATNRRFEYVWKVRINAETRVLDWEGANWNDLAHPASFMVTLVVWRPPNQHFKDHLRWITILIVSILTVCLMCVYSSHVSYVILFTKTQALSCQKDRKNKYKYACGLITKQTLDTRLTHLRKLKSLIRHKS